jgi:hypothetical protein
VCKDAENAAITYSSLVIHQVKLDDNFGKCIYASDKISVVSRRGNTGRKRPNTVRLKKSHGRIGRRQLNVSTGFHGKKKPVELVSNKRARACCCLQTGGSYSRVVRRCQQTC